MVFPKCDVRATLSAFEKTFLSCTPTIPRDRNKFYCRLVLIPNSRGFCFWRVKIEKGNHALPLSLSFLSGNVKIEKEVTLALSLSFSSFLLENEKGLILLSFSSCLFSGFFCYPAASANLRKQFSQTREETKERERERERMRMSEWVSQWEEKDEETGKGDVKRRGRRRKIREGYDASSADERDLMPDFSSEAMVEWMWI